MLILDDIGITPLDPQNRPASIEIIEGRHEKESTLISSHVTIDKSCELRWGHAIADAIMDKIIQNAHRVVLYGESLRKKYKQKSK